MPGFVHNPPVRDGRAGDIRPGWAGMDDIREEPRIRLNGPSGLVAAVPSSLGFHPTNSLVLMCFSGDRHALGPVARVDLPRGRDRPLARQLTATALCHADDVAVVCYPRTRRRPPVLDQLLGDLDAVGVGLLAALVVHAGRVWSARHARTLRLADSMPVPDRDDPDMATLAAANALSGRAVLADREQLRASIAGPRGHRRALAEQAVDAIARGGGSVPPSDLGRHPQADHGPMAQDPMAHDPGSPAGIVPLPDSVDRLIDRALAQALASGTVDVRLAADLAVACLDRDIRDAVVLRGLLELDRSWLSMLISCSTWTPDALAAGICAVLATIAYRHGDGALAQVSLDRCLRAEPTNSLAHLLVSAISAGMPPSVLDGLLAPPDEWWRDQREPDTGDDSAVA